MVHWIDNIAFGVDFHKNRKQKAETHDIRLPCSDGASLLRLAQGRACQVTIRGEWQLWGEKSGTVDDRKWPQVAIA